MNPKIWIKALKVIPRVDKAEWERLDVIAKFLIMTRSAVFVMTIMSAVIGGLLAYKAGSFNTINFIVCLLGLVFAHASNNLINDLTDFKKGVDNNNYYRTLYGPQPLAGGLMQAGAFYRYLAFALGMAVLCGIYLIAVTGMVTFYLALAGLFFILFYTWPLKYMGMGEPAVVLVWGPLMVLGSYYVVSGDNNINHYQPLLLVSLIYAIGPTNVLMGKHIDKLDMDKQKGIHTLPVIIGEKAARRLVQALWLIQYLLVFVLIYLHYFGLVFVLVLLALPTVIKAFKAFLQPRPKEEPEDFPENVWPLYFAAISFDVTRKFGGLFMLALLLDIFLKVSF